MIFFGNMPSSGKTDPQVLSFQRKLVVGVFFAQAVVALLLLSAGKATAGVDPSQVLVLYNEDWTGDAFLTEKGQDSREVAEYYQKMRTDPVSGERPYILGLKCEHGLAFHLNAEHIEEFSRDNSSGVVFRRGGKALDSAGNLRDGRAVKFTLPPKNEKDSSWKMETLKLSLKPAVGDEITIVADGKSLVGAGVEFGENKDFTVRFNGQSMVSGPSFIAKASCADASGNEGKWTAEYHDFLDVSCSRTGPDGIRDDEKYLEDVEHQVVDFLEDPANARPDGTLLKDHILFIVLSYGLPKTAAATYGVARGITEKYSDHGVDVDLGQRLQLIYYDIEGVMGFSPRPHLFKTGEAFEGYFFRAPQAWPLMLKDGNPFVHPNAYVAKKGDLNQLRDSFDFSSKNRKRFPGKHMYFSTRIDGPSALDAKRLVDSAVYASRYAGPAMGFTGGEWETLKSNDSFSQRPVWKFLQSRGFNRLGGGRGLLRFLQLEPGAGFFNKNAVFLPGGLSATVISHNGWNNEKAEMYADLHSGASATAGAARVYRGSPHIHNKSWWDDEILYPCLLRGKTLGECLLMNQIHLEWITSFVADPLMRIPLEPERDETPPALGADKDVEILMGAGPDAGVWARANLPGDSKNPELAQMRLISKSGMEIVGELFQSRPFANLGKKPEACGDWKLELIDPYGNKSNRNIAVQCN